MESERIGEPTASDPAASHHHHHIPFTLPHILHQNPNSNFINQERSGLDFGELEEAIGLQVAQIDNDDNKQSLYNPLRPAATLQMFPSWPLRIFQQQHTPRRSSNSGEGSSDSGSAVNTVSSTRLGAESPRPSSENHHLQPPAPQMEAASGSHGPKAGVSRTQPSAKQTPEKILRRLAQNREAARKSRLRKKAYVQQLESSSMRLVQLEQELQRARSQGLFLGGVGIASGHGSSGGAVFDMEYARWLDDDHRHMSELRTALQAPLPDGDLRLIVDAYVAHYDELFQLKGDAAKSDVFHLISGMWASPAERCFLWIGGFRPSDLIKMLMAQLDPLTEQQFVGIYDLQQTTQQAEEALSRGLEQLQHSLTDAIVNGSVDESMHNMVVALAKLSDLQGFVRHADDLRQHTLRQLRRCLTVRQAARCFLVIGEYYGRLRALSSLWASRPRDNVMVDDYSCQTSGHLKMAQSSQTQFSSF